MYPVTVLLLMVVLPIASIGWEQFHAHSALSLALLAGKWFVFWSGGVRLLLAGARQFLQPRFTAEKIFRISGEEALPIVRELGIGNFAVGVTGIVSLARPDFVLPVAIIAGIFYGLAGIQHLAKGGNTGNEMIAMITDLFVALVLAVYVVAALR